jgi:hypothetical protein
MERWLDERPQTLLKGHNEAARPMVTLVDVRGEYLEK